MSLETIFSSSFLSKSVESFSVIDVGLTLFVSALIGFLIYLVYRKCLKGVIYSQSFNLSLIMMSVISSLIILCVSSNFAISLGMVGALSIVRFRTAVKDPMDIVYIFWSIAAGIVTGAGMFLLALSGSLFIGIVIAIMTNVKAQNDPYLLIINFGRSDIEQEIYRLLNGSVKKYNVKSKTVYPGGACELTVEVIMKNDNSDFINIISAFEGVTNTVLVSYDGDYSV
jgi:hypothetical protein